MERAVKEHLPRFTLHLLQVPSRRLAVDEADSAGTRNVQTSWSFLLFRGHVQLTSHVDRTTACLKS
jgi:hypothetical protein